MLAAESATPASTAVSISNTVARAPYGAKNTPPSPLARLGSGLTLDGPHGVRDVAAKGTDNDPRTTERD